MTHHDSSCISMLTLRYAQQDSLEVMQAAQWVTADLILPGVVDALRHHSLKSFMSVTTHSKTRVAGNVPCELCTQISTLQNHRDTQNCGMQQRYL